MDTRVEINAKPNVIRYTYIVYLGAVSKMQDFEFLTAVLIKIAPSTFMAQCVLACTCNGVGDAYCRHLKGRFKKVIH